MRQPPGRTVLSERRRRRRSGTRLAPSRVVGRLKRARLLHALLLPGLAAGVAAASDGLRAPAPVVWQRVDVDASDNEMTALALEPGGERIAVGDARGVWLGRAGALFARVLRRGPVRDLAFVSGGDLLAATEHGLYRVSPDGRVELRSPEVGAARSVTRIATLAGAVALATGDGAFVSLDGRSWQRLSRSLPSGAASVVGLRRLASGLECWTFVRGELWRASLHTTGSTLLAGKTMRELLPLSAGVEDALALSFDVPGADVVIVFPRMLALKRAPDTAWEILRPTLPPGARARRLLASHERLWLATDRGLLEAPTLKGPWRRSPPPAGSLAVPALGLRGAELYAATHAGLFTTARRAPAARAGADATIGPVLYTRREPSIERVHERALAYLALRPSRFSELRRGLSRRGWLPRVALGGDYERDRNSGWDYDEAFLSGDLRRLVDRDRARSRDWEVTLTLSWDLGDLAFNAEEIDVSREAREVIELRDDVLDEITQLYFERRRVLAELAASDEPGSPRAASLRLRAAELAAGIDAWTGGWFSEHLFHFDP